MLFTEVYKYNHAIFYKSILESKNSNDGKTIKLKSKVNMARE